MHKELSNVALLYLQEGENCYFYLGSALLFIKYLLISFAHETLSRTQVNGEKYIVLE